MFTCPVCENKDYEEIDGLYYCTMCSTQSQELVQEEAESTFDEASTSQRWHFNEIKLKSDRQRKKRDDHGRPWTIYEAYQFIIMAQADAFINLGENKELREIIFSLWAQYLSKIGVAFCRDEKVVPDIIVETRHGRQRELHRGTLASPVNRNKRPFHEAKQHRKSAKKLKLEPESKAKGDMESDDELYPESIVKPSARDKDNIIFIDESSKNVKKALKSPEWMNLRKTIAISYLGLLYTNPQIIPADVIRWIYEGKVPFLSTTHLLPPDMVLSGSDQKLFNAMAFDADQLILEMNRIVTFLNLKKVPEVCLPSMIERFLRELDLPSKLLATCLELRKRTNFTYSLDVRKYQKSELVALVSIGLAMKLLFGLDGITERKWSTYSIKARDLIKSNTNLFVYDEWKAHEIRKSYVKFDAFQEFVGEGSTSSSNRHTDKLLECYHNFQRDKRLFVWQEEYNHTSKKQSYRSNLRNPLLLAITKQSKTLNQDQTQEIEIEKDGKMFRQSSLIHMVDFHSFKKMYKKSIDREDLKSLKGEVKEITQQLVYKEYPSESKKKKQCLSRPENYLWLLEIFHRISHCSVMALDQGISRMQLQLKRDVFKSSTPIK